MKKIVDRETAYNLRALVDMGKARVVKEYVNGNPEFCVYSKSGKLIGFPGERYKYVFEAALIQQGSRDGLFEGFHQTTLPASTP